MLRNILNNCGCFVEFFYTNNLYMSNKSFNGIIYKIFCSDPKINCCYIGSTKNVERRMREHKMNVTNQNRREHKYALYETIRQNGGWNNWNYSILANVQVNTYHELRNFEKLYIKNTENTLNKIMPARTRKEHYEDEKARLLAYKRSYHQNNRVEICKKRREKYAKEKEKNRIKGLKFYHLNKDKINAKRRQRRIWMDGSTTSMASNLFNHLKSKNHKENMLTFKQILQDHLDAKFPHLNYKD
tara:strand:- start:1217 stop:1945 length:729 start_codon:yes stop_codon:yes gene_type:complete